MNRSQIIKSDQELAIMREGGKILAEIVEILKKEVVEGNTSFEVDKYANFLCKRFNVKPAFLGYRGFKYTICSNLNSIVVHGYATKDKFKSGDIFGLDMGIIHHGLYLDMSYTVPVGDISPEVKEFLDKTHQSMMGGIKAAKAGNTLGDIAVSMRGNLLSDSFSLMEDFVGHGIGHNLHEYPDVHALHLNAGEGLKLEKGMVLAIEAISVMGPTNAYDVAADGWTVYTKGKKYLSALYEHTVIVGDDPEIITIL